jgi:integrase
MNQYPGLEVRGTRYYLRVRIPADLTKIIGRKFLWKSLDTGNRREAIRRYHRAKAELDQWFDAHRRRRDGIPPDEVRGLASAWFHETDQHHARADFALTGPDLSGTIAELGQELFDLRSGADPETIQAIADRLLIAAGWPSHQHVVGPIRTRWQVADVHDPELDHLIRRGLIELSRRRLSRLNGQTPAALDPIFAVQPVAPDSLTLSALLDRFLAERAPAMSAKSLLEYEADARVLKEVWGPDLPARDITREHCRQIRDLFEVLPSNWTKRFPHFTTMEAAEHARQRHLPPMAPKTANQHISRMSTILRWAEREEHIDRNPAAGLRVSAPETNPRDARRPFTTEQLQLILNSLPERSEGGRFWIPLICLFSGLRMGEACQLRTDDIEHEHGVPVLQVRPGEATRLKTKHSRRTVPIHPELIRIGLLDFATRQREAGHDRLFPELQPDRRGTYSGDFQRWANRWLDHTGARAERQSFHSTRHAFTDALRRAGATGEVIDGLLGWSRGSMRDRYGSGPWIKMLAEVVERVEYPGLDLSHLYR